jgi:hypothetical protein
MRDAARDAQLILAATAQTKWVRWQATVNLMEIAAEDGMADAFDSYAAELRKAPLGPWLKSHFLLFLGEGLEQFGRYEAAEQVLCEAVDYSNANQIHQVSFKAQSSLSELRTSPRAQPTFTPPPAWVPEEVNSAARAIAELRKTATAS